jgi:hypothetical protein
LCHNVSSLTLAEKGAPPFVRYLSIFTPRRWVLAFLSRSTTAINVTKEQNYRRPSLFLLYTYKMHFPQLLYFENNPF